MATPQDIYQAFLKAGYDSAEAVIMTATAFFESDFGAQAGNGGGLLQFTPDTWKSAGVACSESDINCQAQAARKLTGAGKGSTFGGVWFHKWFVPEWNQSHRTSRDYVAEITKLEAELGTGPTGAAPWVHSYVNDAAAVGQVDPGATGLPQPGIYPQIGGAVSSAVTAVLSKPLSLVGQAIADAAGAIGKAVLPWLIILGIGFFALIMLGRELGSHSGTTVITQAPANRGPSAGRAGGAGTAAEAAEVAA